MSFEDVLSRLRSMEVEQRPYFINLALARLEIEEWPPIPELALIRLEQLMDAGLDGYTREAVDLAKKLADEQKRLGLEPYKFESDHERLVKLGDKPREEGIHPVPPSITGERLTLIAGDFGAKDWKKRIPHVLRDPGLEQNLAILAALTVLEAGYLDRKDLSDEEPMAPLKDALAKVRKRLDELDQPDRTPQRFRRILEEVAGYHSTVKYVVALIRYRRPDFYELPYQEQLDLLEMVGDHIGKFHQALRQLDAALEYGEPGKDLRPKVAQPSTDVLAAVMHDVYGLTPRQIAARSGVPPSPSDKEKGGHSAMSQSIKRGRRILEGTLGEEGWREWARAIRGAPNDPPNDKSGIRMEPKPEPHTRGGPIESSDDAPGIR